MLAKPSPLPIVGAMASTGNQWVSVADRLPLESDGEPDQGLVWWWDPEIGEPVADFWDIPSESTHWHPMADRENPPEAPRP